MKRIILKESQFNLLIEAVALSDIYDKYYSDINWDLFLEIIASDPTYDRNKPKKMGKYGKWLLSLYKQGKLKEEDLYKANDYLRCFIDYHNVIQDKDINKIKSLQELYDVVRPYLDGNVSTSKSDEVRRIKEGAEKVYEDNDWMIIIPHTEEASCYYGKGTQWCTAAEKSFNYFEQYNEQGPLYINIDKRTNEKYQFHFETDSFMDETDTQINFPINENIPITNGAINYYLKNVEHGEKLLQVKYFVFETYDGNGLYLVKNVNEDFWSLYEDDEKIISGIEHNINFDNCYETYGIWLDNFGYTVFNNVNGLKTLISYDRQDSTFNLVGNNYTSVLEVENYDNEYVSLLDTTDSNGTYKLISIPSNTTLYHKKNGNYLRAKFIVDDIVAIITNNGYYDLVNCANGETIEDVKPYDGDYFIIDYDDEYDCMHVLDIDGNHIRIDINDFSITYL